MLSVNIMASIMWRGRKKKEIYRLIIGFVFDDVIFDVDLN